MDGWSVNKQKQWGQVQPRWAAAEAKEAGKASEVLTIKSDKWLILFTQSGSGPYSGFRRGKAPMWLSIDCWKKTKCYQDKGKWSLDKKTKSKTTA